MRWARVGWFAVLGLGGCFTQSLEAAGESGTGEPPVGSTTAAPTETDAATPATSATAADDPATGGTGPADSLGEAASTGFDVGTGNPTGGPCCEAHTTPGCDDMPGVQECVCDVDAYCCEIEWDVVCVDLAGDVGCATCGMDMPPVDPGDCCWPNDGALGCIDTDIADCVCAYDPFCCEYSWDDQCVQTAADYGCGCGSGSDTDGMQDCCEAAPAPGCADAAIQACVCAFDPFCCDTAWDNACVGEVASSGCGACVYPLGTGDCCVDNGTAGCDDQDIQDCVCAIDPFCCTTAWDDLCVGDVAEGMCGECPFVATGGSDSDSGSGSSGSGSGTGGYEPATGSTTL